MICGCSTSCNTLVYQSCDTVFFFSQLDSNASEQDVRDLFAIAGSVVNLQHDRMRGQAIVGKLLLRYPI